MTWLDDEIEYVKMLAERDMILGLNRTSSLPLRERLDYLLEQKLKEKTRWGKRSGTFVEGKFPSIWSAPPNSNKVTFTTATHASKLPQSYDWESPFIDTTFIDIRTMSDEKLAQTVAQIFDELQKRKDKRDAASNEHQGPDRPSEGRDGAEPSEGSR
jgi:hypothetical protein